MIKRLYILVCVVLCVATMWATVPTRFFVGKTEVSEVFWSQMPDSVDYVTSIFHYDSLTVKSRELPFTHFIDSISKPGEFVLRERDAETIAKLERAFARINTVNRERSLLRSVGDHALQISLLNFKDESVVDSVILPGECYLLSFWATWCGNCLQELKPEFLPSIADRLSDTPSFHFIPICIDSTPEELRKFFDSETGRRWRHLADVTYLDIDRKANIQYGKGGVMPLNVVVGRDGLIRFIHSGALKDKDELSGLYEAIKSGL